MPPWALGAGDLRYLHVSLELKLVPLKISAKQQVLQAVIMTELLCAIAGSCQDRVSIFWETFHISLQSEAFWTCGFMDLLA